MSLIVQVNNGGPPAGSASTAASPVASAAVTVSANILAPSPPGGHQQQQQQQQQPTDFSIARQLPQQPALPMLKKSPLPPAAPAGPLPGNLSRVVAAHQQSRLTLTTLPEQQHIVQHHPPPLRMIPMSPQHQQQQQHVALPQSPLRPGSLLAASNVQQQHNMRSPTRLMQMQAMSPQQQQQQHAHVALPQTPIGQRQLQQAGLVATPGRPARPVLSGATVVRMPAMPPVSGVLTAGPPPGLLQSHHVLPAHFTLRHGTGRLPQPPSNLMPLPPNSVGFGAAPRTARLPMPAHSTPPQHPHHHHQQHHHHMQPLPASLLSPPLAQSSTAPSRIFPPNAFPQQFYSPRRRSDSNDELDLSDPHDGMQHHMQQQHQQQQQQQQHPIPLHRVAGRGPAAPTGFPVARGRAANVGRTPVQAPALQDHNYASRPPPTPPPPVQSPPPTTLSSAVLPDGFASFAAFGEHQLSSLQQPVAPSAAAVAAAALGMASPVSALAGSSPILPPTASALDAPLNMTTSVSSTPFTREQQNSSSIEDAGVGPMAPLTSADDLDEDDDDVYRRSPVRRGPTNSNDNEEGEETETAPEEQDEEDDDDDEPEDSITRCICDFLHDDGYMICCDGCSVWQHVVCMGLDKNNIPEKYLCEVCRPRPVDRKRARAMQARRRSEIFKRDDSSDDSDAARDRLGGRNSRPPGKKLAAVAKKMLLDRSRSSGVDGKLKRMGPTPTTPGSATKNGKGKGISLLTEKANRLIRDKKSITKISWKKKTATAERSSGDGKKLATPKSKLNSLARRKSLANSDDEDDSRGDNDDDDGASDSESALLAPKLDASQHLRSWIDQYEEAVTNHYSPELRARLVGGNTKMSSIVGDLRSSVIGGPVKCNVSLKGNGVKILTANTSLSANTPVIECKGRLMLASQFRAQHRAKTSSGSPPHVFFYPLSDAFEICLDGKTYGNDSRFCRRSANANAELRHVVEKGSLHLFIVTTRPVDKNQEIVLPPDAYDEKKAVASPLQSISADLREIKKPLNGLAADDQPLIDNKKRKSETPRRAFAKNSKDRPRKPPRVSIKPEESVEATMSPALLSSPKTEATSDHEMPLMMTVNGDTDNKVPLSPTKMKPSPAKLGLPDNSGLIVGVNTINYDADSSVRNKSKSREERKMEMILRQFEAMEKAEQRKREHPELHPGGGGMTPEVGVPGSTTKRRRSSSAKTTGRSNSLVDSAVEASSAEDEAGMRPEPKRSLKKKGKKGAGPQRRRSRVMSGESVSAASEGEVVPPTSADYGSSATPNTATSSSNGPFRFPKTKKMLMSDWLHESEAGRDGDDDDDDVSGSYLRGSRSPPGIATHLLRTSAATTATTAHHNSPTKTVSAKKRWLRQAISEDHSEEVISHNNTNSEEVAGGGSNNTNGSGSPGEVCPDYVTPLKKRRLANFKEDQEQECIDEAGRNSAAPASSNEDNKYPSSLKKKLLNNMVLEAVLDRAMEDMLGGGSSSSSSLTVSTSSLETTLVVPKAESKAAILEDLKPVVEEPKPVRLSESLSEMGERELSCAVKTPEPSSVFRSYFKSDVSLEELEAQLEATRRQRDNNLAEQQQHVVKTEALEPPPPVERSSSKEELPVDEEEVCDMKTVEVADVKSEATSDAAASSQSVSEAVSASSTKDAKEKRKVSLADYRKRRGKPEDSNPASSSSRTAAASAEAESSENTSAAASVEEPGTPTLDEQVGGLLPPIPMLNPLPLFEKLEKLEQAHKENSLRKAQSATAEPESEPKREDLTERLKKTFGLSAVEDEEAAASATPVLAIHKESVVDVATTRPPVKSREFSPHPHPPPPSLPPAPRRHEQPPPQQQQQPPPSSSSQSQIPHQQQPPPAMMPAYPSSSSSGGPQQQQQHRYGYTPTQYPTYPNNYPVPPYPKSSSSSSSGAPPPSAYPSSSSAPPPPPHSTSRSVSEDGHSGGNGSNSSNRRGEYYSHRSSSSSGYYPESGGRKGDRGDRRDRDPRDHRDRDYHRDKDYRDYHHHYRGSGGGGGSGSSGGGGGRKHSSSFHGRGGGYYS